MSELAVESAHKLGFKFPSPEPTLLNWISPRNEPNSSDAQTNVGEPLRANGPYYQTDPTTSGYDPSKPDVTFSQGSIHDQAKSSTHTCDPSAEHLPFDLLDEDKRPAGLKDGDVDA